MNLTRSIFFRFIFIFLLGLTLFRFLSFTPTEENKEFQGTGLSSILYTMQNYKPSFDVLDVMEEVNLTIDNEWDILDGFRLFINRIAEILEVVIFVVLCIACLIDFIFWCFTWILLT